MTGPFGGFIADVVVFLYALAGCITYVAVIGDQIEDFASAFNLNVSTGNGTFTEDSLAKQWYMSRPFIVPAVSVLFILPFLMLKNIGALSWTSFLGITACLYIAGVIVVKYGIFAAHGHVYPCDIPRPKTVSRQCSPVSWEDFFNSFPLLCFAYQVSAPVLP
jgi:amino acid permease